MRQSLGSALAGIDPRFALLLACFFLSGLAGLIYQTAWTQQFALVFGTSELALVTAALIGLVAVALVRPATPWRMLSHAPISDSEMQGGVVYYGVGRSATVLLLENPGGWRLTTNGLPESSIDGDWERPGRYVVARWLSLWLLPAVPRRARFWWWGWAQG